MAQNESSASASLNKTITEAVENATKAALTSSVGANMGGVFNQLPALNSTNRIIALPEDQNKIRSSNVLCSKEAQTNENLSSARPALYMITNRPNYIIGQQIQIFIWVFDEQLINCKANVNVEVQRGTESVYNTTVLLDKNIRQTVSGPNTDSEGIYKIIAKSRLSGSQQVASITIKVTDLFKSVPAFFVYLAIVFLAGLITLILVSPDSHSISEIFRFTCITGIVLSVLSSLLLTDLQIGYNSPVGLVIRNFASNQTTAANMVEWSLNIGGSWINNFSQGILIPIYVIVFGIAGGYLRYLYKSARLKTINSPLREILLFRWNSVPGTDSNILRSFLKERLDIEWLVPSQEFEKSNNNQVLTIRGGSSVLRVELNQDNAVANNASVLIDDREIFRFTARDENGINIYQSLSWRSWLFYQSLEDLALLFLAPLLAIAIWFLLVQAGISSNLTLALSSFTVGLVTDEVVRALLRSIRRTLGTVEQGKRDPVTEPVQ